MTAAGGARAAAARATAGATRARAGAGAARLAGATRARAWAGAGAALLAGLAASCGGVDKTERSAADRGRELFSSRALSRNSYNDLSCADCHATSADDARLLPGASMLGVLQRPSYWGGDELDLLESLNQCLTGFMLETRGLEVDDPRAVELYAFFESLPPLLPGPQPFTFVREIGAVPAGDAARGEALYAAACSWCHGAPHTGEGRAVELAVVVPEGTLAEHGNDPTYDVRTVVVEKVRHGRYLGFGGFMPPFSRERLSDQDVGDVLAFLGL
ncbi:MAG TPA: c-type cytochrome [Polyangiaceae bacterium]|nr:c-type cytochrome [Polyangiaceae bacterium]